MDTFLIKNANKNPVINPLRRPVLKPIVIAFVSLHQWSNLFKNQKEPIPIIPNVKVVKTVTKVLNPEVKDLLFIPTITEVDSAPTKIKPKIANKHNSVNKRAIRTLMQINIIPRISMANRNRLNSSSIGAAFCKKIFSKSKGLIF